jgi:hypothetical protein
MHKESTILLSTAYLPPIEYMALFIKYENVIIEKNETYPKQTYRNRCKIMSANGILKLPIPVNKPHGNNTKISEITISNTDLWSINHWRAINSAYSGSPFFLYYKDDLIKFYSGKYHNLLEFNTELINVLLSLIGVVCNLSYSKSFQLPNTISNDFRFSISPKKENNSYFFKKYVQVFSNKYEFIPNLSIIDLLFNLGPETKDYLENISNQLVTSDW